MNGDAQLVSLWGLLTNPYALWQYPHTISGSMITASMVMAGVGGLLPAVARASRRRGASACAWAWSSGLIFSLVSLFPTGAKNGEQVTKYQPIKMAAMEGLFKTQEGAPMAIIGMPDTERRELMDPIFVPRVLSYLAYGDFRAKVVGLDDYPARVAPAHRARLLRVPHHGRPRDDLHRRHGAGGIPAVARTPLRRALVPVDPDARRRRSPTSPTRPAGWWPRSGRQPWVVYGLQRTADATSPNVSSGMAIFTLLGFMGLYALLGIVYLGLFAKIVNEGPVASAAHS